MSCACSPSNIEGPNRFALPHRRSFSIKCGRVSEKRTIERLWRDAIAAGRQTPAYLDPGRRRLAPALVGRGERTCRGIRERTARARRAQGRRVLDPRHEQGRVGALRLRARLDRGDRRGRSTRTAHRRTRATSSSTRNPSASSARTTPSARRSKRCAAKSPGSSTCSPSPTSTTSPLAAAPMRPSTPTRSAKPARRSRRTTSSPTSTRPGRPGRPRAA